MTRQSSSPELVGEVIGVLSGGEDERVGLNSRQGVTPPQEEEMPRMFRPGRTTIYTGDPWKRLRRTARWGWPRVRQATV